MKTASALMGLALGAAWAGLAAETIRPVWDSGLLTQAPAAPEDMRAVTDKPLWRAQKLWTVNPDGSVWFKVPSGVAPHFQLLGLTPTGPWVNRLIDMERLRQVYIGWGAARFGTTGFLHWGLNRFAKRRLLDALNATDNPPP